MEVLAKLGVWNWLILAAILFVLEVMSPGIFLMWFGMAAAVTALIAFAYDISWQWQLIWFCGLSLAAVLLAAKYLRKHPLESERPLLNERAVQLIGQSFDLIDPIANGEAASRPATRFGGWKALSFPKVRASRWSGPMALCSRWCRKPRPRSSPRTSAVWRPDCSRRA